MTPCPVFLSRACYNRALEDDMLPLCWLDMKRQWSLDGVTVTPRDHWEYLALEALHFRYA